MLSKLLYTIVPIHEVQSDRVIPSVESDLPVFVIDDILSTCILILVKTELSAIAKGISILLLISDKKHGAAGLKQSFSKIYGN